MEHMDYMFLCPQADLFRTTPFPEIRGKYGSLALLLENVIEMAGFVKERQRYLFLGLK
jgi:hypothetical protein